MGLQLRYVQQTVDQAPKLELPTRYVRYNYDGICLRPQGDGISSSNMA